MFLTPDNKFGFTADGPQGKSLFTREIGPDEANHVYKIFNQSGLEGVIVGS